MEKKSFRKRSASAKASAIFRAHSGRHFSEIVASRFPTLFPYLINVTRAPIILTAHLISRRSLLQGHLHLPQVFSSLRNGLSRMLLTDLPRYLLLTLRRLVIFSTFAGALRFCKLQTGCVQGCQPLTSFLAPKHARLYEQLLFPFFVCQKGAKRKERVEERQRERARERGRERERDRCKCRSHPRPSLAVPGAGAPLCPEPHGVQGWPVSTWHKLTAHSPQGWLQ